MAFPFPSLVTHNLRWKLISLLTAILVWLTISSGDGELRSANRRLIPNRTVTVMTAPSDSRMFRVTPESVQVRVSGPVRRVYGLDQSDVLVFVNLTDASPAEDQTRRVQASVPPGILIDRIEPPEVTVHVVTNRIDGLPRGGGL